jgi:hypothetical protein
MGGRNDDTTMKILAAVVVLTVLALVGSRRMRVRAGGPPSAHMLFGGVEFIVIGLLLGSDFINLIDEHTLDALRPFIWVALGWLAFLFGLQFDRRTVARLPHGYAGASLSTAVPTLLIVIPPACLLLVWSTQAPNSVIALAAVTLAASAACTGQAAIAVVDHRLRSRTPRATTLLRFISSLDPVVGVTVFGIVLSLLADHPVRAVGFPWALPWVAAAVCLGLLTAWFFVSLTLTRTSQAELVLYLLGVIALSSGVALGFDLSVLFINFICGITVANLAHVRSIRARLMDLMVGGERFLYLVLLVVAGASWHLPNGVLAFGAVVFLVTRLLGKTVGAFLATRRLARRQPVPPLLGLGLVSQGGMGLAIIIEYRLAEDNPMVPVVMGVAISAILVNELLAPWLVRAVAGGTEDEAS